MTEYRANNERNFTGERYTVTKTILTMKGLMKGEVGEYKFKRDERNFNEWQV